MIISILLMLIISISIDSTYSANINMPSNIQNRIDNVLKLADLNDTTLENKASTITENTITNKTKQNINLNNTSSQKSSNTTKIKSINTTTNTSNTKVITTNTLNKPNNKISSTIIDLKTLSKTSTTMMNYINKNAKIPKITIKNKTYTQTEYLYLLSKAIFNIKNSKISIKSNLVINYINKEHPSVKGTITKKDYIYLANKTIQFIEKNKRAPNWISLSKKNIPYKQLLISLSTCLDYYNKNNKLPNSLKLDNLDLNNIKNKLKANKPTSTTDNSLKIPKSKLNDKYLGESLSKYLSNSLNCIYTNILIKSLANKLTSNLKTDYEKAKNIFNWVKNNINYYNYKNTQKGAIKTLTSKYGNCVDQSHLLIALSRASGIPARYVHGSNCKFTSGYVSGHVWAQILIGNIWVVADTTSTKNSLGVVKNWNINNYKLNGRYSSLKF